MTTEYTESFIIQPSHCNHLRDLIFGGEFMSRLDLVAAKACRYLLYNEEVPKDVNNAVTHKAVFEFHAPCYLGEFIESVAIATSGTDKSISVEVIANRRNKDNSVDKIATANFVFIAIGDVNLLNHHPKLLPYRNHNLK